MQRRVSKHQEITTDGQDAGGRDKCCASRYCHNETFKVVVFQNGSLECRWPVCEKHAKPFFFRHLQAPDLKIEPKRPEDGSGNWQVPDGTPGPASLTRLFPMGR
jgi:hypothetical protein